MKTLLSTLRAWGGSLRRMVLRLRRKQCDLVGHSFDPIDLTIFQIETHALNRGCLERAVLKCRRCKATFKHREAQNGEHSNTPTPHQ